MSNILKYDSVDVNDINYLKPEKVGTSYFSSFSYGDNLNPLYIQTPKLKCLTNISDLKGKKNPYLELEIPQGKYDIYDFFLSLDDKNIKTTVNNSKEWFNKEIPLEAIDDMYKRTTKPFKKDSNPRMKFRLPVIQNEIQCSAYNQQRVFVDLDEIKSGSDVILILHIRGLKILKQYFYCDCYISQIKVFQGENESKYNIIQEYSIDDDEDEVEEFDDIFDKEIIDSFKEEEEEEQLEEEEEEEGREKEIERIREEIEARNKELEKLIN
tara:strand:+ start:5181 stop:5984 length:804 start_codon:yes stop_codon:yes gene_type:complete